MEPTAEWTPEFEQWLQQEARISGFGLAGIAPVPSAANSADRLTSERFTAWIESGFAGEMEYLKRRDANGVLLRADIQTAIPWARSVIVCALDYKTPAPLSIDPAPQDAGWIARYAWSGCEPQEQAGCEAQEQAGCEAEKQSGCEADSLGGRLSEPIRGLEPTDYHNELLHRLQHLEAALQLRLPCQSRCYVDTGPILERAAAANAGIGWIGKNTCVLNQQLGSWLLLAVIVTSIPVASTLSLEPAADRCGSCTRCIDACPTGALIAPRQMDASRCISYLTIEKKGTIPEPLRPLMGRQVFGCDICQDVCPWNAKSENHPAVVAPSAGMRARGELVNPSLGWLASLDGPTFKRYFKNSPLERTRRRRLLRNTAIAMGNSGEAEFLPTLEAWAAGAEEDPVLAEAAEWALRQLQTQR